MNQNNKKFMYTCVVIPSAIASGIIGGISSVITSYFFQPIWQKITRWWNNEHKIN